MVIKFNNDLFSIFSVAHRTPGNLRRVIAGEPVGTTVTA